MIRATVAVALLLALTAPAHADIPAFFRQLHHDHAAAYAELRAADCAAFCVTLSLRNIPSGRFLEHLMPAVR